MVPRYICFLKPFELLSRLSLYLEGKKNVHPLLNVTVEEQMKNWIL